MVGQKDYVFQIRVTPPPAANAPTQVTGLAPRPMSTDESITVSWNTIADVDRYVVEHSTDSSFATHTDINLNKQGSNPPATSVTIDGLTEDTTYYVRVYAVNSDGNGPRSLPVTVSTTESEVLTAPPAPAAPTDLDINAPGQANDLHDPDRKTDAKRLARRATLKQLKADWEEVTIPSGSVTYKVEWRASGESYTDENSHTTIALEYEITGLKRNTEYTVRVSAIATDNGLSTPGPATSETGRTRRAAYDCANVARQHCHLGNRPGKDRPGRRTRNNYHDAVLHRPGLPPRHLRGRPSPQKG